MSKCTSEFKSIIDRIPRSKKEILDNLTESVPICRGNINAYYSGRTKDLTFRNGILIHKFLVLNYDSLLTVPLDYDEWITSYENSNTIIRQLNEKFKAPIR